jgi:hypothetical protein
VTARPFFALTLHKPWGLLIAKGIKKIENRTWSPEGRLRHGDWFAIHNGKKYDERCSPMAQSLGLPLDLFLGSPPANTESAIVAVVRYAGVVAESRDPWFFGPCGWVLDQAVEIAPVPCKGAQGLWPVPPDVAEKVRAAYRSKVAA